MKRLYRSIAHNYSQGGLRLLIGKVGEVLLRRVWSRDEWIVYEVTPSRATQQAFLTEHRRLSFDDLVRLRYEKALAFPENMQRRFARGDACHGFFSSEQLVTIGWSGAHYMELNIDETLNCTGAWGLFDFMTSPEFQGRGYYTDALRQLIKMAEEQKFNSLWIAVHPANKPSIKGIERSGFRPHRKISKRRFLGVTKLGSQPLSH